MQRFPVGSKVRILANNSYGFPEGVVGTVVGHTDYHDNTAISIPENVWVGVIKRSKCVVRGHDCDGLVPEGSGARGWWIEQGEIAIVEDAQSALEMAWFNYTDQLTCKPSKRMKDAFEAGWQAAGSHSPQPKEQSDDQP